MDAAVTESPSNDASFYGERVTAMPRPNKPLQFAALCFALLGGMGELVKLQHWRLRERLRQVR
jgi:hypothetical protein